MKREIKVIQSTHWDYEWYFTNNHSRVLLNFHTKELLNAFEKNKIDYFIFDGQTSIVKEYIEDHPEDLSLIKKLNKEDKLEIGPWFSQTDQFIISGESIVKNLQTGINFSLEIGKYFNVGYVPDAFGQSQDLPKILNGFGIKEMIHWRGKKGYEREYLFKSNDDSEVVVYNIKEGYYFGGAIYWETAEFLSKNLENIFSQSKLNTIGLSLSGDQRYVDFDIKQKIIELNNDFKDKYNFSLGKYSDVFKLIDTSKLNTYSGEFLDSQDSKIHRSIYSNRYDQKYLNNLLENKLINVIGPLNIMKNELGIEIHDNIIQKAWENVLINSAHDAAGGCNSDITNRNIINRFIESNEIVDSYIDMSIRKISETISNKNIVTLFNFLPYDTYDNHEIKIITKNKSFYLKDKNNNEIKYVVLEQKKEYYGSINRDKKDNKKELYYYETKVYIKYNLKPISYETINVIDKSNSSSLKLLPQNINMIKNEYYELIFKDDLIIKDNSGNLFNFFDIYHEHDDGDTYDFSPLENQIRSKISIDQKSIKFYDKENVKKIKFNITGKVNKELHSNKKTVQTFLVELSLVDKWINVKLKVINKTKDSRWRLVINPKIKFKNSIADTPFGFIERPIIQREMENWKELKWKEEPTGIYPLISNLILKDEQRNINFILNGIKEYEAKESGDIELTLFRSVGFLGKPDLLRRPGKASGQEFKYVPTPDSQLLDKEMEFELSLSTYDFKLGELKKETQLKNNKILYYQNQEYDKFTGPLKYFVSNKLDIKLNNEWNLIESNEISKELSISILKELDKKIVLRIYNPNNYNIESSGQIIFKDKKKIFESDLLEVKEIFLDENNVFKIPKFKKGEIKTFILKNMEEK